jgi:hypothetical protein
VAAHGRTRIAISLTVAAGRIIGIDVIAEPDQLGALDVVILTD